jgi:hypothetical protein
VFIIVTATAATRARTSTISLIPSVNDIPQMSSAIQSIKGIKLRLVGHTDGFFMQMQPKPKSKKLPSEFIGYTVYQLRELDESYTAQQHKYQYSPGLQLMINTKVIVPLDDNDQVLTIIPERSSVVCTVAERTDQQLVFTIEPDIVYDHANKDIMLQLTATADSYMQLAATI